jgi:hypothetical protein
MTTSPEGSETEDDEAERARKQDELAPGNGSTSGSPSPGLCRMVNAEGSSADRRWRFVTSVRAWQRVNSV